MFKIESVMPSADVLIIGGGVIGASIAFQLGLKGQKRVVVLDRSAQPGLGSTGAATGGFRVQFSSEVNVRLSLASLEILKSFQDLTGVDPRYIPAGYLFLASNDQEMSSLRRAMDVQRAVGATRTRQVSVDEARDLNPVANLDGIVGGSFSPVDRFTTPLNILKGFREAATRLGAEFRYGVELHGLRHENGKVISAQTSEGEYTAEVVVNAAGAWAGKVARMAGYDLPVRPVPRHVAVTQPCEQLSNEMPMTVWASDGFHVRVRNGRPLLIWTTKDQPESSFDTSVDRQWLRQVYVRALLSFPSLGSSPLDVDSSWAGLYEMSPDKTAMVGLAPGFDNFYLANGSSGHGVMHSPAIGQLVASAVIGENIPDEFGIPLSPSRFSSSVQAVSADVL